MFEGRLLKPILEGIQTVPYEELVQQFSLESPLQAQNLLVTAKRMFAPCLYATVAEYATDEQAIETEIRELQIILGHALTA